MNNLHKILFSKKRYLFLLFLFASLCLFFGAYLYYITSSNEIRNEKENELRAIAELKINQLCNWREERIADAKVLSGDKFFVKAVENWLNTKESNSLAEELHDKLTSPKEEYGYEVIFIASVDGKKLISVGSNLNRFENITQNVIVEASEYKRIAFTDFYYCEKESKIYYDIIAPLINTLNETVAVLVFRTDPENFLFPLISAWPTPSKSAETLLLRKDGDGVLFLNELRHKKNTALKLKFPFSKTELSAVHSLSGKKGIFEGKDYRGANVLSYTSPVPGTGWYMVSKIDTEEVLSELNYRGVVVLIFVFVLVFFVVIGLSWLYNYQQKKIYKSIWETREEFKTVLYSIGDAVITTDEHGKVKYLNPFAQELTGWSEAEASEQPLERVFKIVNEENRIEVENPLEKVIKEGLVVGLADHTILISKNGIETPIANSGAPIIDESGNIIGAVLVFRDQTEERLAQKLVQIRLRLFEFAAAHTLPELLTKTLDEVCKLTKSPIGYYHLVLPDQQTIHLQAWTTKTENEYCNTTGKGAHYNINNAGLCAESVREKKPIIDNDYLSIKNKKGLPEGNAPLLRELVVPILRNDNVVAVLGIGNKSVDYSQKDTELVSYLADVVWEITENKRTQVAVKESKRKFETMINNLSGVVYRCKNDSDWTMEYISEAAEDLTGYKSSDFLNNNVRSYNSIIHPDDQQKVWDDIQSALAKQIPYTLEYRIINSDAETKWVWERGRGVFEGEELLAIEGFINDITEAKLASVALRQSENYFRLFYEKSPVPYQSLDIDGNIREVNETWLNMLGYQYNEVIGRPISEFLTENGVLMLQQCFPKFLSTGAVHDADFEFLTKDGSIVIFTVEGKIGRDINGEFERTHCVLHNITERKAAENEINHLNRLYAMLSQSNQAIVRLKERDQLFKEICRVAIEYGKFKLAWIGLYDEEKNSLAPYIWAGEGSEFLSENLINAPQKMRALMPSFIAYNEDRVVVKNNITMQQECAFWYEAISKHNFNSLAATPIQLNKYVIGVFVLYSSEENFFGDKEMKLLEEVGEDISFAIGTYDLEEKKQLAEKEKALLSHTIEKSINEIYIFDAVTLKFRYANSGALNNLGYTLDELKEMTPLDIKPEITAQRFSEVTAPLLNRKVDSKLFEAIHRRKDGTEYPCEIRLQVFDYEDDRVFLAVVQDLTVINYVNEERNRLIQILESAPDFISVVELDSSIYYLNSGGRKIIGLDKDAPVYNKSILEFHPKWAADIVMLEGIPEAEKNGYWEGETALLNKDGNEFPVDQVIIAHKNSNGKVERFSTIARDISQRKKSEYALRASEERFRKLFENHSAVKLLIDPETGRIIDANEAAAEFYGWSIEKLENMKIMEINNLSHDEIIQAMETTKNIKRSHFEFQHRLADGSTRDVEVFSSRIELDGKEYIHSIVHDVTEKKKAEKQLILLSRVSEQSPVIIVITDQLGNIEYVNPKFTQVTGYSFEDVKGKNPSILKSGKQGKEFYKNLWSTILSGKEWHGELQNRKKNGELYWENILISPILDNKGKIAHFVAVKEVITEKKKMIEDIILAKEKAEEMNKVKSYFFANMSHELRTPFVGIQGFAEVLSEILSDPEQLEMVQSILNSSRRLTDTLNKILSLSKIEFQEVDVQKTDVDINGLLNECYKLFIKPAEQKGLTITLTLFDEQLIVRTDEKLLRGVLTNLLNNAVKYTIQGKIELVSLIEFKNEKEYLVIKVADTGIGIPADKQEQIWMVFRQVSEGLNRTFEGTGLGLTITKKYVELLDGTITLESELEKGSTFNIELPIERRGDKETSKKNPADNANLNIAESKSVSKNILYVDDDHYSREVVVLALSKFYNIEVVKDANSALEKVNSKTYDALLIDINLGRGTDGAELMEIIRKDRRYKKIPMIAITAYASDSDREEFLSRGFSHYISKPFSIKELRKLVNGVLTKK